MVLSWCKVISYRFVRDEMGVLSEKVCISYSVVVLDCDEMVVFVWGSEVFDCKFDYGGFFLDGGGLGCVVY